MPIETRLKSRNEIAIGTMAFHFEKKTLNDAGIKRDNVRTEEFSGC